MDDKPKRRWGCMQWGIVIGGLFVLLVWLAVPHFNRISPMGNQVKTVNNCKQVLLCLKEYSKDADTRYPDGKHQGLKSANQVFREFFKNEIITDERIFGSPVSAFNSDREIGLPPNYEKALMPGECHWMLLKYQTDEAHPKTPVVIECCMRTTWPPKWDVAGKGETRRRKAWPGGFVVIGRNDCTVQVEKLRPDGTLDWHSPPNLDEHGKSWIDYLTPEQIAKLSYWDIEEK